MIVSPARENSCSKYNKINNYFINYVLSYQCNSCWYYLFNNYALYANTLFVFLIFSCFLQHFRCFLIFCSISAVFCHSVREVIKLQTEQLFALPSPFFVCYAKENKKIFIIIIIIPTLTLPHLNPLINLLFFVININIASHWPTYACVCVLISFFNQLFCLFLYFFIISLSLGLEQP